MTASQTSPRLTLSHTTMAAKNLDDLLAFYCDVLGFHVTNRGEVPGGGRMAFISQDPENHHQIVLIDGMETPDRQFVMADHLAFRTGTLDDLRVLRAKLIEAKVDPILPISHGNAWSLYFSDPEGNGLECFIDSPFHVAQPFAEGFDLDQSDDEIVEATRSRLSGEAEFQPMSDWQQAFARKLD